MANSEFLQFIAILFLLMHGHVLCSGGFNTQFIASEAEALLEFKEGLKDPSNLLSSWTPGKDCCHWKGVGCNTTTGHVISLNLYSSNSLNKLQGHLSSSLQQLPYLTYLNLSGNDFMQSRIPSFLGTMQNLKHLDLSYANFKGSLIDNLGNLSLLESLNLSGNGFYVNSLKWLHGLSSLKFLDLSFVDLSSCKNDWFHDISIILHSLETLRLSGCQLRKLPKSARPELNCDSLVTLDLWSNYFNSSIPDWLFENCHHLQYLDLSGNNLQGPIPNSIERVTTLATLYLSQNMLNGSIPDSIGMLLNLVSLDLSSNMLTGSIPDSIGMLLNLVSLDLSSNMLTGSIPDSIGMLLNLVSLDLSSNMLTGSIPDSIGMLLNLVSLDLSSNMLTGSIPSTLGQAHGQNSLKELSLAYNKLNGSLDLAGNNLEGNLSGLPPNSRNLDLSNNLFSGTIWQVSLETLDLSFNNFSGVIPNCWTNRTNIIILNFAKNNFIGSIPDSFGSLTNLRMLIMYNNNLSGKIPDTLKNCQWLTYLDLWSNNFWGPIPSWIGNDMQILEALMLGRNSFDGDIPKTLCQLKSLQILDLSQNQLTGEIPTCPFPAMTTQESINEKSSMENHTIKESLSIYLSERKYYRYHGLLENLKEIDLSSNYLTQDIPVSIEKLVELVSLNLSRNQLVGSIPSNIGKLTSLEVLDLSRNQLSCAIPTSMVDLTFLSLLNLSYNTLSGKIPIGTQLQSFDGSSFEGNPHLCGEPLDKACPGNSSFKDAHCSNIEEQENDSNHKDKGMDMEINPFYISMGIGFSTGFWVFWGSLILVASWRHAYFRFLSNMNDRIYVTVVVAYNKLRRKLHAQQPPM